MVRMLRGQRGKGSSVLTCSNLRRAMATAAGALSWRLAETGERIKMLSCTQEISRNVDTISISPPGQERGEGRKGQAPIVSLREK